MELFNLTVLVLLCILIIINLFICYNIFFNQEDKKIDNPVPKKSLKEIFKDLPNNVVLVYYIEGCGWCEKMQQMIKDLNKDKDKDKDKDIKKDIIEVYFKADGSKIYSEKIDKYDKDSIDKMITESLESVNTFPTTITKDKHKIGCFTETKNLKEFINTD